MEFAAGRHNSILNVAFISALVLSPVKTQITVRVDADVLVWLRSQGKGYRSRINAILQDAMLNAK